MTDDHDDTLGGTATHATDWRGTAAMIRSRVGTMRAPNRLAVRAAAWLIRQIVMRAPGFSGAIACTLVYAETETAMEAMGGMSRETAGRPA